MAPSLPPFLLPSRSLIASSKNYAIIEGIYSLVIIPLPVNVIFHRMEIAKLKYSLI